MKKKLCSLLVICLIVSILQVPALAVVDIHDDTLPVVTGIYMNSPGAIVTAGDTLLFSASIQEDHDLINGLNYLGFSTVCEQGYRHYGEIICSKYDKDTGIASFELEVTEEMVNGTYTLYSIRVWDEYDNFGVLKQEDLPNIVFQSITFTVQGNNPPDIHDNTMPVVNGISMDNPGAIVTAGDTLRFSASIQEDHVLINGLNYLGFSTVCEQGYRHYGEIICLEYDKDTGIASFELEVTEEMVNGTYTLYSIRVWDEYDNFGVLKQEDLPNIVFQSITFTVQGNNPPDIHDNTMPVVNGISMDNPGAIVTAGDTLLFSASIQEDHALINGLNYLSFSTIFEQGHRHYGEITCSEYDKDTGIASFELEVTEEMVNGTYTLYSIRVWDEYDNFEVLKQEDLPSIDFQSIYFTVATPDVVPDKVSIPPSITISERNVYTIHPDVTPIDSVPKWTWKSEDESICTVTSVDHGLNCLVTGIAPGTTTVTGITQNNLVATCIVTVTSATLPESGIVAESYNVRRGSTVDIKPTLIPPDATSFFEVTSDNPHVASADLINSGTAVRIYGNNVGKATITIRGANGIIMTTTINVTGYSWERPHEKVVEEGYDATCTSPGRTDAVRCSECYYYFEEPEEIPMKPHTFSEWEIIREATYYEDGLRGRTCEVCGYYETEWYSSFTPEPTPTPRPSQPSTTRPDPTTEPTPEPTATPSPSTTTAPTTQPTPAPTATVEPTPEPTKPQVNVGDQNIEVTVDENTAAVTVPEKDLEEAIDAAAEKGVLEVDVSNLEDVSEFTLSQNVVDAVTKSEDVTGLKLKTANGDITLDGNALQTVADAVTGEHDEVKLSVKTIDPKDIPDSQKYPIAPVLNRAVFIELSADVIHKDASGNVTGTDAIHEFNGDVTVSVPYEQPENMKGRQVIACYIADDGSITYFNVVYKDGIATFTTRHFSTFAIVESYAAAFEDIDISKWYMTSIEYALAHELMAGESDTIFAPDGMVSRAMAVQLLYNLSGQPETDESATFADVEAGKWYAPAIAWAENKKVAAGYGNDQFGPEDLVTREQLATMLWQYAGRPETTGSIDSYEDAADVSGWAKEALCWAVENGIMQGSANHLNPKATASRAEAAALMANLHQMQNQNEST